MGAFIDKLKSLTNLRLVSEDSMQQLARQAAEDAIMEERLWKENPESYQDDIKADDLFNLYQSLEPDLSKLSPREKQIYESWIKGRPSPNFGIDLSKDQPLDYLFLMQKAVKTKYYTDPHARSIINNWTYYTVGGGLKVLMPTDELQEYVNGFRSSNKMVRREKQMTRALYTDGELFISYYVNRNTGEITIRRIRPDEIVEVECHPEDIENVLTYHWEYEYTPAGSLKTMREDKWVKSITYDDYLKDTKGFRSYKSDNILEKNPLIQFVKLGDDTELRGRVPLQPVLKLLKGYEDWLDDRIRLNHERAKVVWIKQITGRNQEAKKRDRRAPRGGIMLVENENVKYRIESPKLDSSQAKEDGLQILYTIGAGTHLPIHILNQRSDEQAYASIRKADTPFSQFIRTHQELLGEEFEIMYRQVLKHAVKSGALPKTTKIPSYTQESLIEAFHLINEMYIEKEPQGNIVKEVKDLLDKDVEERAVETEKVPISIDFPEIIREDPKGQAEVLKIHKELGIASRATLSAKAGYNWKQEFELMKMEVTGDGSRDDKDNFDGDETDPLKDKKDDNQDPSKDKKDGDEQE